MREPCRVAADELILQLALSRELQPRDFVLSTEGVARLHPQLVRCIIGQLELQSVEAMAQSLSQWLG